MNGRVIAIMNGKGGVGKTLLTTNLAAMLARIGLLTSIIDKDPQPTAFGWSLDRKKFEVAPSIGAVQAHTIDDVERRIKQARQQEADMILIDTPPRLDEDAAKIVALADAVAVPLKPEPYFLKALPQTLALLTAAKKRHFVVLTSCELQGPELAEVQESLKAAGTPLAPFVLYRRKPYWNRSQQGMTAADFDPTGKAAAELLGLALWVIENVGLLTNIQKYKTMLQAAERTSQILRQLRQLTDDEADDETSADNLRSDTRDKRSSTA
jgi:chromosome partitioning protein